ncbi:MAG: transposase, partial [Chromatiaceae bacterium]
MLKTLRCPVRVVWVYRKTQWVALMTTDITLSVEQIVEYYSAGWQIEIYQTWCLHKSVRQGRRW